MAIACGGDDNGGSQASSSSDASGTAGTKPIQTSGLPANFPIPPTARFKDQSEDPNQLVVTLQTTDPVDSLATFYADALSKAPWLNGGRRDLPDQHAAVFSFANKDEPQVRGSLFLIRDSADKYTLISVTYATVGVGPSPT